MPDHVSGRRLPQELSDLVAGDLDAAKMRALYVDLEARSVATPDQVGVHKGAQLRARSLRHEIAACASVRLCRLETRGFLMGA